MKLGAYKLDPRAVIPEFKTEQAACFDLVAIGREIKNGKATYKTGLALEIPDGYCVEVYSRSGHGFGPSGDNGYGEGDKRLVNCVGIIDADYTGEIVVRLSYDGISNSSQCWPEVGDRIAQAKLVKLVKTEIVEVYEQKQTERGNGGFGSTGK